MEVTRENIDAVVAEMAELVPTAKFIAIDEEMTGIHLPSSEFSPSDLDTMDVRYAKMRAVAMAYNVIQMGVCLFHEDPAAPNGLIARPYNFYVFPSSLPNNAAGPLVRLEPSAVEFNTNHGMDWTKWISRGIPYVNAPGEQALIKALNKTIESLEVCYGFREHPVSDRPPIELTRADDIAFVDKQMEAAKTFFAEAFEALPKKLLREQEAKEGSDSESENAQQEDKPLELVLAPCNSFLRLGLFMRLREAFVPPLGSRLVLVSRGSGFNATPVASLLSDREAEEALAKEIQRCRDNTNAKLGFRRVWRLLSSANVPIIGHNCLYDFLFMVNAFERPLPPTWDAFRELFASCFPAAYCTKLIFGSQQYSSLPGAVKQSRTHLGQLYESFQAVQRAVADAKEDKLVLPVIKAKPADEIEEKDEGEGKDKDAASEPKPEPEPITYVDENYGLFSSPSHALAVVAAAPGTVTLAEGFGYDADSGRFHEAAFDAYCTGYVYAHLASALAKAESIPATAADANAEIDPAAAFAAATAAAAAVSEANGGLIVYEWPSSALDALRNNTYLMFSPLGVCLRPGGSEEDRLPSVPGMATFAILGLDGVKPTGKIIEALAPIPKGMITVRYVSGGVCLVTVPASEVETAANLASELWSVVPLLQAQRGWAEMLAKTAHDQAVAAARAVIEADEAATAAAADADVDAAVAAASAAAAANAAWLASAASLVEPRFLAEVATATAGAGTANGARMFPVGANSVATRAKRACPFTSAAGAAPAAVAAAAESTGPSCFFSRIGSGVAYLAKRPRSALMSGFAAARGLLAAFGPARSAPSS